MARRRFRFHRAALLALAAVLAAGPASAAQRIVAAGAAVTEILWELGAADEVVGVDSTSKRPAEALATRPDVGYYRRLAPEGLLSLAPTLVVAVDGAGPRETFETIGGAGIRVVRVPESWSAAGVRTRIEAIGRVVGRETEAARLAAASDAAFARLAEARGRVTRPPRVLFLMSLAGDRALAAGRGTPADALIGLVGGVNVAADFEGYRPMTDEAVIGAAPEVVAMMDVGQGAANPDRVFALPAFAATPAATGRRLVMVDGVGHLGFGPHVAEAMLALMPVLHGGAMDRAVTAP